MKWLITGSNGFVGKVFASFLRLQEPDSTIYGADIGAESLQPKVLDRYYPLNLLDFPHLTAVISETQPDYVLHLASFSSVSFSWENPLPSFQNNTNIFLNLLECIRNKRPQARILSVGSSEEYGIVTIDDLPLTEDHSLKPASPYAVARVAQEHMSIVYAKAYNLPVICTRSFNHLGAGQSDQFVISSIAKKIVEYKKGLKNTIRLGDTSVVRDFLSVHDVVKAYYGLLLHGNSGSVYNICSGHGVSLDSIVQQLCEIAGVEPHIETDPDLLRPIENPRVIGSHQKITQEIGWTPQISLFDSLVEVLGYWDGRVS